MSPDVDPTTVMPLAEVERRHIEAVLAACGGNKSAAAGLLRIDRKTLLRKVKGYALGKVGRKPMPRRRRA